MYIFFLLYFFLNLLNLKISFYSKSSDENSDKSLSEVSNANLSENSNGNLSSSSKEEGYQDKKMMTKIMI